MDWSCAGHDNASWGCRVIAPAGSSIAIFAARKV